VIAAEHDPAPATKRLDTDRSSMDPAGTSEDMPNSGDDHDRSRHHRVAARS
jgi:hypothetical protein